ncbi:MAG: hypothetical protein V4441_09160 [Pseudomonadota bacterium]
MSHIDLPDWPPRLEAAFLFSGLIENTPLTKGRRFSGFIRRRENEDASTEQAK